MPLDGIIHSYADNQNMGDYGPAIITEHFLEGRLFYMLFGHLSRNSIKDLQIGEQILKGTLFAELGSERENGNWPPHLHFQLISDIGDHFGDFPGVVKKSDIDNWLGICPDPGIIFNL
jgi:hypothetical protein